MLIRGLVGLILALCLPCTLMAQENSRYGFVLPYQESGQFERSSIELALSRSNLAAIHLDQSIPWYELLAGKPLPEWLSAGLERIKAQIPAGFEISLAITPTAPDRVSLASASGPDHHTQLLPVPGELANKRFDDPLIRKLFLRYANALIEIVRPDYVNVGIEISELAVKNPDKWNEYEALFLHILPRIKERHPDVKVGMEMVLQSIMEIDVQKRVLQTFTRGDFLGFSFYPYGSEFAERAYAHAALPRPPEQWRLGFRFMSQLSSQYQKPLAFCETGYLSREATAYGVNLAGSDSLQVAFTRDLMEFSRSVEMLFVIWFVPLDYHRALLAFPDEMEEFKEAGKLWSYSGLWHEDRTPKPALSEWMKGIE